ncbi:MAG TPA: hypothetical protein ACFYD4_12380 [Candidatus Wunengus sp. YC61]
MTFKGDGTQEMAEVTGRLPFEMYGCQFATYKRQKHGWWRVVELSTGLSVGIPDKKMRGAVAEAKEKLAWFGEDKVQKAVKIAIRRQRKEAKNG